MAATSAWFLVTPLLAATLLWAMAVVLLFVRCPSRANRPFAAYLLLHGGAIAANALSRWDLAGPSAFWVAAQMDIMLLALPVLVYFALQYVRPFAGIRLTLVSAAVLATGAAIQLLHLRDHCLAVCAGTPGQWAAGPLFLLYYGWPLWSACVALALLAAARRYPEAKRTAVALVSAGLAFSALLHGLLAIDVVRLSGFLQPLGGMDPSLWADVAPTVRMLAVFPATACLAAVAGVASDLREQRRRARLIGGAVVLVAATALAVAVPGPGVRTPAATLGVLLTGAWGVVFSSLIAFALLRHRLFGLDRAVKVTVSRSTVAAIFVGVFLVVSQVAEQVAQDAFDGNGPVWGTVFGGVAAGLLLFALHPLARFGGRVADAMLPGASLGPGMSPEQRTALYRDQVALVWSDGVMGMKERALLDALRTRLGIRPAEALRLEQEALAGQAIPASPARPARRQPV